MDDSSRNDDQAGRGLPRRSFLKQSLGVLGAGAALTLLPPGLRSAAWASGSDAVETTKAKLGFIALTDAAPLFVADELGLFAKHGMTEVEVLKQSSWGTTRDNLVLGSAANGIDGAHILTPMVYHLASGKITPNGQPLPMALLARLNVDGQGISLSNDYKEQKVGLDASGFKTALAARQAAGKKTSAAMTFPGGTHDLWIRYWLAANGIDPNKDITTLVVPPAQMVANMKVGNMDTFCVGEPWNAQLIKQNIGYSALTTGELWANHPEKALALRGDYVQANPKATVALLKAVLEAQQYCDVAANKPKVAEICAKRRWIGAPAEDVVGRLQGTFDYGTGRVVQNSPHLMKFWNEHASFPYQSHDLWFITENQRWGYLPGDLDAQGLIAKVNRADLWREAAAAIGVPAGDIPTGNSRGKESFFDGKVFDPADPQAYLASLTLKA